MYERHQPEFHLHQWRVGSNGLHGWQTARRPSIRDVPAHARADVRFLLRVGARVFAYVGNGAVAVDAVIGQHIVGKIRYDEDGKYLDAVVASGTGFRPVGREYAKRLIKASAAELDV